MTLGDPGCFAPFLLNVYRLQPGQAIFVPAGEIHAYIQGDCIEVGIFIVSGISNQLSPYHTHTRSCPVGTTSSSVASCMTRTWPTSPPSSRTPTSSPRSSTSSQPPAPWSALRLTSRVTSASPHLSRSSS